MKRWELARFTLSAAEAAYYNGEEEQWMLLFKWAVLNYSPERSPRQKEIQRLWQQRGLLERTKANVNSVMRECELLKLGGTHDVLNDAYIHIDMMIEDNKAEIESVKERIPA